MSKVEKISFSQFVNDPSDSIDAERAARFLNWAAVNLPHRFVPWTWVTKHARGLPKLPSLGNGDLLLIRSRIGSIKSILWKEYGRRTTPSPRYHQEPGIRALVDDDDHARNDLVPNKKRIHNSILRLSDTRSKIDTSKMNDNGLVSMVLGMDPVIKSLTSSTLMNKLRELPPRPSDDDAEDTDE